MMYPSGTTQGTLSEVFLVHQLSPNVNPLDIARRPAAPEQVTSQGKEPQLKRYLLVRSSRCLDSVLLMPSPICSHVSSCIGTLVLRGTRENSMITMKFAQSIDTQSN